MKGSWLWTGSSWMMVVCECLTKGPQFIFLPQHTNRLYLRSSGASPELTTQRPSPGPKEPAPEESPTSPARSSPSTASASYCTSSTFCSRWDCVAHGSGYVTVTHSITLRTRPLWVPPHPTHPRKKINNVAQTAMFYFNNISVRQAYISQLHKSFNRTFAKHNSAQSSISSCVFLTCSCVAQW